MTNTSTPNADLPPNSTPPILTGQSGAMSDARSECVVDTWIWPTNVRPLAETISRWIGYFFDESDWSALKHGLSATDRDNENWFTYPLGGDPPLDITVAQNVGD